MKVQNTTTSSTTLYGRNTHGRGGAGRVKIPAGATLELDDAIWKTVEAAAQADIEAGGLVITVPCKLTAEEQAEKDAAELKAAEALVAKAKTAKAPATAAK